MSGSIRIQYQTPNGIWITAQHVFNFPENIIVAMRRTQGDHPGLRVRAIDDAGRLVDML